ncbi:hypothetical protein WDW89_22620 [Deltaproteobacteria bacterium TL4]
MNFNIRKMSFWLLMLVIACYLLTPRFYEPGGESWKAWTAAALFKNTGEFPLLSMGPLYYLYLNFFLIFPYPLSLKAEFFITHCLFFITFWILCRKYLTSYVAFLLVCAWIPSVSLIEGNKYVAGMALLALHYSLDRNSSYYKGFFPPLLLLACLVNLGYLFFWLGHALGYGFEYKSHYKTCWREKGWKQAKLPFALKLFCFILVGAVWLHPSHRVDNNHYMTNYPHTPIALDSAFNVGFFQLGDWKYVIRNYPESEWFKKDWYLTHQEAYGNAKTFREALFQAPKTVFLNLKENIIPSVFSAAMLVVGPAVQIKYVNRGIFPVALVLLFLGMIQYVRNKWENKDYPQLISLVAGSSVFILILFLTHFTERYFLQLLPVITLVIFHIDFISSKNTASIFINRLGIVFHYKNLFFGIMAVSIFTSSLYSYYYPKGVSSQIIAVFSGEGWIQRGENITKNQIPSWNLGYAGVFSKISPHQRILTDQSTWIKSFADVHWDNVYDLIYLPPFLDSGETGRFLETLDVILISYYLPQPQASWGTQSYLRYLLHIKPFLDSNVGKTWKMQEIEYYGFIYEHINTRQ